MRRYKGVRVKRLIVKDLLTTMPDPLSHQELLEMILQYPSQTKIRPATTINPYDWICLTTLIMSVAVF